MESNLPVFEAWEQERHPIALSYEELVRCGAAVKLVLVTIGGPAEEIDKMKALLGYLQAEGDKRDTEHEQQTKEGKVK